MNEVEVGIIITVIILGFGSGALAIYLVPGLIGFILMGLLWGLIIGTGWYMKRSLRRYYSKLEKPVREQMDEVLNYRMPGHGGH